MVSHFGSLVGDPYLWALFATYWFTSAAIGAMPMPDTTSSKFYGWFFKFANTFFANISRATAGKIPGTSDVMPLPAQPNAPDQIGQARQ